MAKDRKKLQHIHSSIPDKQPTAASLEVAEIAVNNAADKEFLSIKNTNDKVVRFSSDGQIIEWIERKEVMPYVGYVRGAAGPSATSGDTPTADGYGSYGIENTDLLNNKSELVFKLNQVAADLTTKHDKVNGKKDMYNKDVNPTTDGGINDGAGFFIDMSRYAMQDANPQFSSTTNTCRTTLSGTTIIRGLDGDCGSLLDIVVNSAYTSANTATTIIKTANTSATTATLSGNTLTVNENQTIVNSCGKVEINTDSFSLSQCSSSGGSAEFEFCNGYTVKSNDVKIEHCDGATSSSISIKEKTIEISGTTINEAGTTVNVSGSTSTNISGGTVNVSGGTVNSSSANEACITAGTTAAFVGADKTNIGKNCSDGGQTTTLNINGDTINETGNTVNISASTNVNISADTICESAKTEADFYAPKTQIGVSCNGSTATTVNINGTTINEGGTNLNQNVTNYDLNGAVICISGSTNSNFYGKTTNVGVDCGGTTATTVNVSGTTINEGGTTNNNTFTTVNNTATTINNSTTTYNITGTSNVNVYGGDVCISGGTDASLGAKTVKIGTDCGTNTIATGVTINATTSVTVNAPTTIITGDTYISGDTTIGDNLIVSGDTYLDGSLHLTTGLNKPIKWVYDNVCNHASGTTKFDESSSDASRTITIPSSAAHIKRETLSWTYGSVTNATNGSYDPGSNTTTACTRNSDNSKFIIPKTVSDVTNGTVTLDTCLNVNTDICVTGKVSASNGFFQTSDRNSKENIERPSDEKFVSARNTPIFKFNYKDDEEHRDIYGVIAQDAEANGLNEVVYTDENGKKAVDYTSLMILKIGYLEHDNVILRQQLAELYERVKKLEENK